MEFNFIKMHGLGNDFVIFDCTKSEQSFSKEDIINISDRRTGVGCDQVLVVEKPHSSADIFMRIYNSDGSHAQACGNGTRCVARMFMDNAALDSCTIETVAGLLECSRTDNNLIQVDMGKPLLNWNEIPLSHESDTMNLGISEGPLGNAVAVNVGNPHVVFFVDKLSNIDVQKIGSEVERHVLFPERTNVEFVQVMSSDRLRVRVWERGAGITQACGSGACATIVAAVLKGKSGRKAEILLDGGSLNLEWREGDRHILMEGPAEYVFYGATDLSKL
jgi:diaminopimelate epimerase